MSVKEKLEAGRNLTALIISRYQGRVPRADMGDLAIEAGYQRRSDWGGYMNGKRGLVEVAPGILSFQPSGWEWLGKIVSRMDAQGVYSNAL